MTSSRRLLLAGAVGTALVASVVLFWQLGASPLWDPDEGRHAEIARELYMASSWHERLAPRFDYTPYRDKPVFFYWLVAAAYAAFGVTELAARLVPALAALATVLATYRFAAHRIDVPTAVASALVLVTSLEFVALGRLVTLDMLLTLWITLGVLAVDRAARGDGSLVPAAVAGALGFLTKGLAAPVLIGGVGLVYLALTGRLASLRQARLGRSLAVFLVLALPWVVVAGALHPGYIGELFLFHHVQRFLGSDASPHREPFFFYVPVLLLGFFPWSPLLPAALARARRGDVELLCATWAGVVVGFFTLSSGKLGTYILPAFPPLAVLMGMHLARLWHDESTPPERRLTRAGLWVVAVMLVVAPIALCVVGWIEYDGVHFRTSLLALPLLPAGGALVWMVRRDALALAAATTVAGAVGAIVLFYALAVPRIGETHSSRALAEAIAAHPDAPLAVYQVRPASIVFYARRPVLAINRTRRLERLAREHPLAFVVTSPRHVAELETTGRWHPWVRGPRRVLYGTQPPSLTSSEIHTDNVPR